MIDGMVVREMGYRCMYDLKQISKLKDILWAGEYGTGKGREKDKLVQTLWSHYEDSGFLSARILNYLDEHNMGLVDSGKIWELIKTLPAKPFDITSVHDCFRCLPNYGNDIRRQYNQILSDLARSDILCFLATQITGSYVPVAKSDDIADLILESDYALS